MRRHRHFLHHLTAALFALALLPGTAQAVDYTTSPTTLDPGGAVIGAALVGNGMAFNDNWDFSVSATFHTAGNALSLLQVSDYGVDGGSYQLFQGSSGAPGPAVFAARPFGSSFAQELTTGDYFVNVQGTARAEGASYGLTVAAVPEPSEWAMLLGGLAVLCYVAVRRSRRF